MGRGSGRLPSGALTRARSRHWAAVPFGVLMWTCAREPISHQFRRRRHGEVSQCLLAAPHSCPTDGIVPFGKGRFGTGEWSGMRSE